MVFATSRQAHPVTRNAAATIFLSAAVIGTTYVLLYFEALRHLSSSIAIVLFFLYPAVTLVFEWLLFKTAIPPLKAIAAVVIVIGSGLAVGRLGDLRMYSGSGLLFAVLAPLCYCIYLQITSPKLKKISPWTGALLIYSGLGTGFLIVVAVAGLHTPVDLKSWLQLIAIVVFGSALPTAAFAYSMPRLGPPTASWRVVNC